MEKSLNNNFGPVSLSLLWMGLYLVFGLFIAALSVGSSFSSEVPFVLRISTIIGLICGTFLISLSNIFFFMKFWYINGFTALVTGGIIAYNVREIVVL
jgi:hypothetical protein